MKYMTNIKLNQGKGVQDCYAFDSDMKCFNHEYTHIAYGKKNWFTISYRIFIYCKRCGKVKQLD